MKHELILVYAITSLHEAANFVWNNNRHVTNWPSSPRSVLDVMAQIKEHMLQIAKQNAIILNCEANDIDAEPWIGHTSTGGYMMVFSVVDQTDDHVVLNVDILVDPGLCCESEFVTEIFAIDS